MAHHPSKPAVNNQPSPQWKQAQANYDRLSRWYDLLTGKSELSMTLTGIQKLGLRPGETILEIGCGTGRALLELAQTSGKACKVHGVDISRGMLLRAWSKLRKAGLERTVFLAQANALNLPYPAETFDAILVSFTLELFPSQQIKDILQECQRVLQTEGRLSVISLAQRDPAGRIQRIYEWLHGRFPALIDCRPIPVSSTLQDSGFHVIDRVEWNLYGIPVEIAWATRYSSHSHDL